MIVLLSLVFLALKPFQPSFSAFLTVLITQQLDLNFIDLKQSCLGCGKRGTKANQNIGDSKRRMHAADNSPQQYCSEQYFSCYLNILYPMLMKLGIPLTIHETYNLTKFRPNPSTGSRVNVTVRLYGQTACMFNFHRTKGWPYKRARLYS